MPLNLQAKVDERFKSFGSDAAGMPVIMGTLGSFMVGAKTEYLDANDGLAVVVGDIITTDDTSSVTISGDFSFAEMAWLQTGGDL